MRISGAALVAVFVMLAAGATIATAGIGTLVTSGEDGVRANASQAPIGTLSATPRAPTADTGGGGGGDLLGERDVGGNDVPTGDTQPLNDAGVAGVGDSGGGAGTLPFTGFLALLVLGAGAVMLLGGVVLRRRAAEPA